MALWRLMKNSIRFAFRAKKRWITFVIIFAFLATFTTLFVSTFNEYNTAQLMRHKGFYIKADNNNPVTESVGEQLVDYYRTTISSVEKVVLFRYFDLGEQIRFYSVDPADKWLFEVKPSNIFSGRYISSNGQAIVSTNAYLKIDAANITGEFRESLKTGDTLQFINDGEPFELNVVGQVNDTTIALRDRVRIYITNDDFDYINQQVGGNVQIYSHSIALTVTGELFNPFNEDVNNNMLNLMDLDSPLYIYQTEGAYGEWGDPRYEDPLEMRKIRTTNYLYFGVGILGGIILTILYNFLLGWFRKREIAVLRAMGYEKGEIRINLLGESLTISMFGYLLGILAILVYFLLRGYTLANQLLTPTTLLLSFIIVVVISIPGMLISSFSINRVSTVILFKGR